MCVLSPMRPIVLFLCVIQMSVASAGLVRYEFEVVSDTATLASGYFVFDNDIPPPPPGMSTVTDDHLLFDLDFSFNGIDYDETTANGGIAGFSDEGELTVLIFGSNCSDTGAGACTVQSGTSDWDMIIVLGALEGSILYSIEGVIAFNQADIILSGPTPVPLLPTVFFMVSALAAVSSLKRRR